MDSLMSFERSEKEAITREAVGNKKNHERRDLHPRCPFDYILPVLLLESLSCFPFKIECFLANVSFHSMVECRGRAHTERLIGCNTGHTKYLLSVDEVRRSKAHLNPVMNDHSSSSCMSTRGVNEARG
jgi:hypothetical protein